MLKVLRPLHGKMGIFTPRRESCEGSQGDEDHGEAAQEVQLGLHRVFGVAVCFEFQERQNAPL